MVYEISTNDFTFNGVYLTSGGTIKAEITDPSSLSFTEYRSGGVLIGDLINFDANLFFSDGGSPDPLVNDQSPFRFYARDISTGERISTEKYFFVDYSFKGYADSVAMTKASSYYEFVVEYGERGSGQEGDIATYEVAINSISLSNPEYPPSEMKFKELRETSPDGIAFYPIHDLVIGIEDYVSTPLLRKWKVAKTYEGATVDKDWNEIENPVFYESTKLNLGEDEYVLTITPEMEPNGVFISLVNVYSNGEESVSTVYYYLPGNLTGNVDDGTDIVDVTVDTSDTTLARAMLRARVSSTFLKDYSFEQFERADLDNDGRITTLDYIGVSGYKYSAPIIYYMY
ncbi:MAG: hypothetical protein PF572_04585 [Patescibacteria group bacterium]|nr:hypothetical protein [Patescibacteria group bacterium]